MNSALKPVLPQPQPGAGAGGQASPAKGNVANANHSVGLPQGAQNSHHTGNSLVGQNLTQHAPGAPPPPPPPHVPSMAPVSANMAQMAQNMSHHGNLSHVTQNSVAPPSIAVSPNKAPSTSAPLSLVQDKPQPLALTRTPEKKEPDSTGPANGTIECPKSASNAPAVLKPQNPEPNKEKQDIAKTSPSTPKPPEKPTSALSTLQTAEPTHPAIHTVPPAQPKVATANEPTEKSPAKPSEPKPAPTADVAPSQTESKPVPESANDSQLQDKQALAPQKPEPVVAESAKTEGLTKAEEKKEEPKVEKPAQNAADDKKAEIKADKVEPPKKEEPAEKLEKEQKSQKPEDKEKLEEKKPEPKLEVKAPTKAEIKVTPRSTLKLATVTPPMRKRRQASPKAIEGPSAAKKAAEGDSPSTPDSRAKRNRTKVQLYQSPTPELTMATKLSASAGRATPPKPSDDKLIVFYKNEYLAVRNAEGGFYVCQAMQNVYRTTRKIKIRWLSQDKSDPSGETYKPDFYDVTDMECVLTTLSLTRAPSGGKAQILKPAEEARARSILERAIKAEQSGAKDIQLTEEHPDGLDLSLYTDESQLEKKSRKRTNSKTSPRAKPPTPAQSPKEAASPAKKARTTPKRSPKTAQKAKPSPPKLNNKRKPAGTTPTVAATSKTATAVTEKAKAKSTPPKRSPAKPTKVETPVTPVATPTRGRRAAVKEIKPIPAPTPSTSTGKTTRTPRKPPAKK